MRIEHYKLLGTRQDPKSQAPLSLEAHSAAAADRPEISISVSGVEYCARKQKENERTCSRGWKTCPGPEPGCPTEQLRPERGLEEVKGLTGRALQEEAESPEGGTLREGRRGRCGRHGGAGPARVGGGCGRAPTLLLASARVDSSGFPGQETQARARHSLCRKDSALPCCLGAARTPRTDAEDAGRGAGGRGCGRRSPGDRGGQAPFHVPASQVHVFFGKMSIPVCCPFFNWTVHSCLFSFFSKFLS